MSALSAKLGDRAQSSGTKSKYLSQNINQLYSGKSALPAKTSGSIGKHGLQSVGNKQTAVVRRMPPPVHLPSLRSESSSLGSADAEAAAAAQPPTAQPSWAPSSADQAPAGGTQTAPPGPPGPQPLIPKLRETGQPRWMGDSGPSARDFPSLATATDPKLPVDSPGPVLRPQKGGSWKAGGAGGAGKDDETPQTPPGHGNNNGVEEDGRRSSSPPPSHYPGRHFNTNNNFNPPFVSQRPPPPPAQFFRNSGPQQPPAPLMRGGYEQDYYEGPPPRSRYGPGPDRQGQYPPDEFRGPPRHFDQDYGPPPPQPPPATRDRVVWSDEEGDRKEPPPPTQHLRPMGGRGDERVDYPVHPPAQRGERYPDYEYEERYRQPPHRDGYGGPPIIHHGEDYRQDYRQGPGGQGGPEWYGPAPPGPHGPPYHGGSGAGHNGPNGPNGHRGGPDNGTRGGYYRDMQPYEYDDRPQRNLEDEEEEERRLRFQQEREREAAIQRSRQKRRQQLSEEQAEGPVPQDEGRPLSRDRPPPPATDNGHLPHPTGPHIPGPPAQRDHRRPPQTQVPPRFQRQQASEEQRIGQQADAWDDDAYTPRHPERKEAESEEGRRHKDPGGRRRDPPKRTERGLDESSWRRHPKEDKPPPPPEEDDDAPQLQPIARSSKAVKRTPKARNDTAQPKKEDPKPQPPTLPSSGTFRLFLTEEDDDAPQLQPIARSSKAVKRTPKARNDTAQPKKEDPKPQPPTLPSSGTFRLFLTEEDDDAPQLQPIARSSKAVKRTPKARNDTAQPKKEDPKPQPPTLPSSGTFRLFLTEEDDDAPQLQPIARSSKAVKRTPKARNDTAQPKKEDPKPQPPTLPSSGTFRLFLTEEDDDAPQLQPIARSSKAVKRTPKARNDTAQPKKEDPKPQPPTLPSSGTFRLFLTEEDDDAPQLQPIARSSKAVKRTPKARNDTAQPKKEDPKPQPPTLPSSGTFRLFLTEEDDDAPQLQPIARSSKAVKRTPKARNDTAQPKKEDPKPQPPTLPSSGTFRLFLTEEDDDAPQLQPIARSSKAVKRTPKARNDTAQPKKEDPKPQPPTLPSSGTFRLFLTEEDDDAPQLQPIARSSKAVKRTPKARNDTAQPKKEDPKPQPPTLPSSGTFRLFLTEEDDDAPQLQPIARSSKAVKRTPKARNDTAQPKKEDPKPQPPTLPSSGTFRLFLTEEDDDAPQLQPIARSSKAVKRTPKARNDTAQPKKEDPKPQPPTLPSSGTFRLFLTEEDDDAPQLQPIARSSKAVKRTPKARNDTAQPKKEDPKPQPPTLPSSGTFRLFLTEEDDDAPQLQPIARSSKAVKRTPKARNDTAQPKKEDPKPQPPTLPSSGTFRLFLTEEDDDAPQLQPIARSSKAVKRTPKARNDTAQPKKEDPKPQPPTLPSSGTFRLFLTEEDDDAPQLQPIARSSKAVKRTPKARNDTAQPKKEDPKPQPPTLPSSEEGRSESEKAEAVGPAPEPQVNVWEKRAEERESAERQLRHQASATGHPGHENGDGGEDEHRQLPPRASRNREFYNSRNRIGGSGRGGQQGLGGPGSLMEPRGPGAPSRSLRGRGPARRGASAPVPRRRERDEEDEEDEDEALGDEDLKENGEKVFGRGDRSAVGRGGRRGGSTRRGALQYPQPGYYFQPPPEGPGPNPFGPGEPYMGPGRGGDRRGRGGGSTREHRTQRADGEPRRRQGVREPGQGRVKGPRKTGEKKKQEEKRDQLGLPGGGIKSPSHSEGQDEWETASESSDIGVRQREPAQSAAPQPPPVQVSPGSGPAGDSKQHKDAPRVRKNQQPKNAKAASRQGPPPKGEGKKGTDELAGIDPHDIARVVAIDDHPDSPANFSWDTGEFQEVISRNRRKEEKRLRNKVESGKEKRETRSASNRAGPDRRQQKKGGAGQGSPPPKSGAPPLIPALGKAMPPPPQHQSQTSAPAAPKALAPLPSNAPSGDNGSVFAFWEPGREDSGNAVAAAFEDYVKKSSWGASPKQEELQPSKTGTEIWGTPDPLPFTKGAEPERPPPAKSVEFPVEFGGSEGGDPIEFTFNPNLPPTPAQYLGQTGSARPGPVPGEGGEEDAKLSQRLNLAAVRKVWQDQPDASPVEERPSVDEDVPKEPPQVAKVNPLPQVSPQSAAAHYPQPELFPTMDPQSATGPLGKAFYASSANVTAASPPMLAPKPPGPPDMSQPPPPAQPGPPIFGGHGIWQGTFTQPPPPTVFPSPDPLFGRNTNSFYQPAPMQPGPGPTKQGLFSQASPFVLESSSPHSLMAPGQVLGPIGSQRPNPNSSSNQAPPPPGNNFFLTASPQQPPPLGPPPPPHHNLFGGQPGILGPPPNQSKFGGPFGHMPPPPPPPPSHQTPGPNYAPGYGPNSIPVSVYNGRPGPPKTHPPLSAQSSGGGIFGGQPPHSTHSFHPHPHHGMGQHRSNGGGHPEAKKALPKAPTPSSDHNAE